MIRFERTGLVFVGLLLVVGGCSDGDTRTTPPGSTANAVEQSCQQVDYIPGQPRTADWVSTTRPETEPSEMDPQQQVYLLDRWLTVPLKPSSYPYTVREIQYELGSSAEPPCSALIPHAVQAFIGTSQIPPESPTIERTWMTEVETGNLRTLVRHAVEPSITLEEGDVFFVALQQPQGTGGFPCPVACRAGDDVDQIAFRSAEAEAPYGWTDMTEFFSYRSDPTVPWIAMADEPLERIVPNVAFDAPSDGSQDNCIAHIEPVDDAGFKCTVNHLCGDDGYRLTCLSPTSCACAVNSEPGGTVEKPEELCRLPAREAEALAIEICGW